MNEKIENSTSLPHSSFSSRSASRAALFVAAAFLLLFILGAVPRYLRSRQAHRDTEAALAAPEVSVVTPKPGSAVREITLSGNVEPLQTTKIYPRAKGYLKKLYADIGDVVVKDQLLAEIDTPELDASLAQATAQLGKTQSDLSLQQATVRRFEPLRKNGSVSQQEADEKQTALSGSEAAIKEAQANVERLSALKSFQKVFAPFSGTVVTRNFDLGALLSDVVGGVELFQIDQVDVLRVFGNVPQVYVGGVLNNDQALLSVRNYPGRTFNGTVTRSSGSLDPISRTLRVQVDFKNSDNLLRAGMFGEIKIPIHQDASLTIPSSAMLFDAEGTKVAVVLTQGEESKISLKKVELGRDFGSDIEVLTGIAAADQVVVNPSQQTFEGAIVKISERPSENPPAKK